MGTQSLAWRAFVALLLMIGFYVFAIAIVLVLLFIPFAEWQFLHRLDLRIAAFCVIGAIVIAISILPQPDHFVPPGPRLDPKDHPEFFIELARIAKSVEQALPAEVYLAPDVNAWVAQRGGVMGFGSRRVMGVGLALMNALNLSEFRAVLAHEFGHFYGGDTRLGPWVYKTRAAIIRTVQSLGGQSEFLQLLFVGYAKMFLRITHGISRQQEYSADALAARSVGAAPLISGLRITHGAAQAFSVYWQNEVAPVLNAGFIPPIAEGFAQFMRAPQIDQAITQSIAEEIKQGKNDPYDTHPTLRDRIAAIEKLPSANRPIDARPALTLLANIDQLERQLLAMLTNNDQAIQKLQSIAWVNIGDQVYLQIHRKLLNEHHAALAGITPAQLPDQTKQLAPFIAYLEKQNSRVPSTEDARNFAGALIGSALFVLLHERGWTIHAPVGLPLSLSCGEQTFDPFQIVPKLLAGELTADAWRDECARLDIAKVDLSTVQSQPN